MKKFGLLLIYQFFIIHLALVIKKYVSCCNLNVGSRVQSVEVKLTNAIEFLIIDNDYSLSEADYYRPSGLKPWSGLSWSVTGEPRHHMSSHTIRRSLCKTGLLLDIY